MFNTQNQLEMVVHTLQTSYTAFDFYIVSDYDCIEAILHMT